MRLAGSGLDYSRRVYSVHVRVHAHGGQEREPVQSAGAQLRVGQLLAGALHRVRLDVGHCRHRFDKLGQEVVERHAECVHRLVRQAQRYPARQRQLGECTHLCVAQQEERRVLLGALRLGQRTPLHIARGKPGLHRHAHSGRPDAAVARFAAAEDAVGHAHQDAVQLLTRIVCETHIRVHARGPDEVWALGEEALRHEFRNESAVVLHGATHRGLQRCILRERISFSVDEYAPAVVEQDPIGPRRA
mmetsp:Transcript_6859/g.17983  ORF Transcript_6859/g.17983 Transcript_6859/m.17983 type:complete len:246 (+) Transcript_6859:95-832(+)